MCISACPGKLLIEYLLAIVGFFILYYKIYCIVRLVSYNYTKEKNMKTEKRLDGTELTIKVSGRLDTTTSPQLEAELKQSIGGITKLVFDLSELEYLSSAGLRVLLSAHKTMDKQGEMIVKNVNDAVNEIFEITGFIDILTIE